MIREFGNLILSMKSLIVRDWTFRSAKSVRRMKRGSSSVSGIGALDSR